MLRLIAAISFVAASATLFAARPPAAGEAQAYAVDAVHSSVIFRVNHAGVSYFYGRFNSIEGAFTHHPDDASQISFDLKIKADSIDSNSEGRDNHLKSPDFFNAVEFPWITFKSTGVKSAGTNLYDVTGDLSLHGVTKPITARLEFVGSGEMRGQQKAGFDASFTIKRSDFGMSYMLSGLGDEVKLMVGLEGNAK
jgi:polyisoprenoid-binding protein YceI